MRFTNVSLTTLLTTIASASPLVTRSERAFSVTDYSTSYFEPQDVYFYRFNISGPGDANIGPAFSTSCNGSDTQLVYRVCNDPDVFATIQNVTAGDRSTQQLVIQRRWNPNPTTTLASFGNVTIPKFPVGTKEFLVPGWLTGELGP